MIPSSRHARRTRLPLASSIARQSRQLPNVSCCLPSIARFVSTTITSRWLGPGIQPGERGGYSARFDSLSGPSVYARRCISKESGLSAAILRFGGREAVDNHLGRAFIAARVG